MMLRTLALLFAATLAACFPHAACAQKKIVLGHVATAEIAAAFVASAEGYFKDAGLPVDLKLIPLNPSMPPALQSDAVQFATITSTTFLQAVDGGLDLVIAAEGSVASNTSTSFAVFARTGSGIKAANDFIGKKVGVPGMGAILHVWFRRWLMQNGVDPKRVTFVESGFPQHADLIRGGNVDAVVTAEPMLGRLRQAGTGYVVTSMTSKFERPLPIFYYVSTRAYAAANPSVVSRFREALRRGTSFADAHPDKAKLYIAQFTGLPPEITATIPSPQLVVAPDRTGLQETIDTMRAQGMLRNPIDAGRLYAQ